MVERVALLLLRRPHSSDRRFLMRCLSRAVAYYRVILFMMIGACGGSGRKAKTAPSPVPLPAGRGTAISHVDISSAVPKTVRMGDTQDFWILVRDANQLIYDYSAEGTQVTSSNQQAQADFEHLLAGTVAVRGTSARSALSDAFVMFAERVLRLGSVVHEQVLLTDFSPDKTPQAIADARDSVEHAVRDLLLTGFVSDTGILLPELRGLFSKVPAAEQAADAGLLLATLTTGPSLVRWRSELLRAPTGPKSVLYHYPGSGDYVVKLRVVNRLGEEYRPNRFAGDAAEVAVLKPAFPRLQMSFGLTGLFGARADANLVKVSVPASTTDTFEIRKHNVARLSLIPSTFFSFQHGVRNSAVTLGGGIGVGLHSSDVGNIDDTTDLMAVATIGYEWIRLSLGYAYTSEITSFNGTFQGGGADSTRTFTTDPNALQQANRTRIPRFLVSLHMTH
jgi:hypothetical protein